MSDDGLPLILVGIAVSGALFGGILWWGHKRDVVALAPTPTTPKAQPAAPLPAVASTMNVDDIVLVDVFKSLLAIPGVVTGTTPVRVVALDVVGDQFHQAFVGRPMAQGALPVAVPIPRSSVVANQGPATT